MITPEEEAELRRRLADVERIISVYRGPAPNLAWWRSIHARYLAACGFLGIDPAARS